MSTKRCRKKEKRRKESQKGGQTRTERNRKRDGREMWRKRNRERDRVTSSEGGREKENRKGRDRLTARTEVRCRLAQTL